MATTQRRWSYDDLLELPDDGTRYEIIDGELIVVASPSFDHQIVTGRLYSTCLIHVEERGIGTAVQAPYDVVLPSGDTLQPDVAVFLTPPGDYERARARGAVPDLVIEVHSPSTRADDLNRKRRLYAEFGVEEYWPVDIRARSIQVLVLREGRYQEVARTELGQVRSTVIPGLVIDLDKVFFGVLASDAVEN